MQIAIDNEVERLEEVIVHRPGDEIYRMTQHQLVDLLFDDILSPPEAAREHDMLVEILRTAGAKVHDIMELLERALGHAPAGDRQRLLHDVCDLAGEPTLFALLDDLSPRDAARALVRGLTLSELPGQLDSLSSIQKQLADPRYMPLAPLPNLMFMRDPCISVFDRAVVGRMSTSARAREPLLAGFALRHCDPTAPSSLLFDDDDRHRSRAFRRFEGGDVLVLSPQVVLIGCSQRTTPQSVQRVAAEALFPSFPALERVYAVMMPEARSVMHLDTILTQIDRQLFLGHVPSIAGTQTTPPLRVAELTRAAAPRLREGSVLDVLREELGREVELVPCGGDDPVHQEREQWTDGANAVCLSPGHIMLYSRNVHTIAALAHFGFEEVRLNVVQPPALRRELIEHGMARERVVFSFSGSELSRARGGGRCLTMPIRRGRAA